jgi:hypothetical protein
MCDLTYGSEMMKADSAACKIYVEVENTSYFIAFWKLSLIQGLVLKIILERYAHREGFHGYKSGDF